MKLNAAAEMMPITWPEFGALHPFCPPDQARDTARRLPTFPKSCARSQAMTPCRCSPTGAQGEYAGLLTIQGYHRARGQGQRNICLIPMSAHGTNPASAQMAGWRWWW
jgi:glycine dehydrogenase